MLNWMLILQIVILVVVVGIIIAATYDSCVESYYKYRYHGEYMLAPKKSRS